MRSTTQYAPVVLRVGLAIVFYWFGVQQLMHPSTWVGFLPDMVHNFSFISPELFVRLNGWGEIFTASLMLSGFWLRGTGILTAFHMFGIATTAGGAIGMRDFGLGMACLTLACFDASIWSADAWVKKREQQSKKG